MTGCSRREGRRTQARNVVLARLAAFRFGGVRTRRAHGGVSIIDDFQCGIDCQILTVAVPGTHQHGVAAAVVLDTTATLSAPALEGWTRHFNGVGHSSNRCWGSVPWLIILSSGQRRQCDACHALPRAELDLQD